MVFGVAVIATAAFVLGSGSFNPGGMVSGHAAVRSGPVSVPGVTPTLRSDPAAPAPPTLGILGKLNGLVGGSNVTFPLNFTVPSGVSDVLYAWSIGGGLANYSLPTLPTGMTVVVSLPSFSAGFGSGVLAPGSYSTDLFYAGWTNTISIVVYGVFGGTNLSYQFASVEQPNPVPHNNSTSSHNNSTSPPSNSTFEANLTLPSGGVDYLGVENTGGYAIASWSMPVLNAYSPAWLMSGQTEVIGTQLNGSVWGYSAAEALGLVGAVIYANGSAFTEPTPVPLAAFSATVGGNNLTFPLNFTVPSGVSDVLYVWAIGGGLASYSLPNLPKGLTVVTSGLSYAMGVASGALAPGTYTTDLYYAGWTNTLSIEVFGVYGGEYAAYRFASVSEPNPNPFNSTIEANLTLLRGGVDYIGVAGTGGHAITNWSMPEVDALTAAWEMPGVAEIIGAQTNDTISARTDGEGLGLVGVGIYTNFTNLTFRESGLRTGASWTVAVLGSAVTTTASSATFSEPQGGDPYTIVGPAGYRVSGIAPSGSLTLGATALLETFSFVKGKTLTLKLLEKGLPPDTSWCAELGAWEACTTNATLDYAGLTPGTYAYALGFVPGVTTVAKAGGHTTPLQGSLLLAHSETIDVTYEFLFTVTFNESGLGTGDWNVTIRGTTISASAGSPIVFHLPDGTYSYKIDKVAGYVSVSLPKPARVDGGPVIVSVLFSPK